MGMESMRKRHSCTPRIDGHGIHAQKAFMHSDSRSGIWLSHPRYLSEKRKPSLHQNQFLGWIWFNEKQQARRSHATVPLSSWKPVSFSSRPKYLAKGWQQSLQTNWSQSGKHPAPMLRQRNATTTRTARTNVVFYFGAGCVRGGYANQPHLKGKLNHRYNFASRKWPEKSPLRVNVLSVM